VSNRLSFAYADPPYVGCAAYYDHPDAARWDTPPAHVELMAELDMGYDGWALSCSVPSLGALLAGAPDGVRVAAWVKPFAAFKRNVRVAYTWEPVIWHRTAPRRPDDPVSRDHLAEPITLQRGLTGAKPERFASWVLEMLGWQRGDTLDDLFPGTGVVGRVAAERIY
jgi:hypothetical protein